jgi:hypothetical protein
MQKLIRTSPTSNTKGIDHIVTNKIPLAEIISMEEENKEAEEDDTTPHFPVTNTLDHVNEKINCIF